RARAALHPGGAPADGVFVGSVFRSAGRAGDVHFARPSTSKTVQDPCPSSLPHLCRKTRSTWRLDEDRWIHPDPVAANLLRQRLPSVKKKSGKSGYFRIGWSRR